MKLIRMAALAALLAVCAFAQTTISDTIYLKPGTLWTGQITVSWSNFTTADGIQVAAGQTTTIVQNGALSVQLWPNIGAAPAIAYTASYFTTLAGSSYGKAWVETWNNVPASPSTITLATARTWSSLSGNFTLNGSGPPSNTLGANGDFYLSTTTSCLYGPKAANAWPGSCVSITGVATATSPITYNSGTQTVACPTCVVTSDSRLSDARAPTGAAGGGLAGNYPNPSLGAFPACVGTPGNTTGRYQSLCIVPSTGALFACKNAADCAVAADWASAGSGGASYPGVTSDGANGLQIAGVEVLTSGSPTQIDVVATTVAALPASGNVIERHMLVSDGAGATDCTAGGGGTRHWCYWSGSAWTAENGQGPTGSTGSQGIQGNTGATGPGYLATSATSLVTAGSGSKAFTTQSGLAYTAGARVRATSAGTAEYMEGLVSSYSSTTLTVTMDRNSGTGTHSDWNINVVGDVGAQGPSGTGNVSTPGTFPSGNIVTGAGTTNIQDGGFAASDIGRLSQTQTITGDKTYTGKIDNTGATHTLPIKSGSTASRPGTCTASTEFYNITDAGTGGQQLYVCNAAGNGWNLVGDGGATASCGFTVTTGVVTVTNSADKSCWYFDETFPVIGSSPYGTYGWIGAAVSGGTPTYVNIPIADVDANHFMGVKVTSAAVINDGGYLALRPGGGGGISSAGYQSGSYRPTFLEVQFRISNSTPSTANMRFAAGIGNITSSYPGGFNVGAWARYDTAASDTTFMGVAGDGNTTATASTISGTVDNTIHRMLIWTSAYNVWNFSLDGGTATQVTRQAFNTATYMWPFILISNDGTSTTTYMEVFRFRGMVSSLAVN